MIALMEGTGRGYNYKLFIFYKVSVGFKNIDWNLVAKMKFTNSKSFILDMWVSGI